MSAVLPDRSGIRTTQSLRGAETSRRDAAATVQRVSDPSCIRWPFDSNAQADEQLFIHPKLVPMFERLGWITFDKFLEATQGEYATSIRERHRPGGWDNLILELKGDQSLSGTEPGLATRDGAIRLHVKQHRPDGNRRPRGLVEAEAIAMCQGAAVPCMEVAALGIQRTVGGPGRPFDADEFDSIFMSFEITNATPASQVVECLKETAGGITTGARERRHEFVAVIDRVASTAARMHAAGLFHGDCHWPHFYLANDFLQSDDGARLIDLQGLRRATGLLGRYLWIKDMAQLRESSLKHGVWSQFQGDWEEAYNRHAMAVHSPYRLNRWTNAMIAMRGTVRDLSVRARRSTRARRRKLFDNHPAYHAAEHRNDARLPTTPGSTDAGRG